MILRLATRSLASSLSKLGPHGIRVNCVNPNITPTEMARLAWSDPARSAPRPSAEMEPEDGVIWVQGLEDESVMAVTDFGVDSLVELIKIHRESTPREER